MIYTVTLSPSLDYVMDVNDFCVGSVNRSGRETVMPGGKGINVSLMLRALGCDTRAVGFLAGFTGEEIAKIRDTAPYGHMVVTHTDSYKRYTKTTVEPIGYYVVNTLGVDGGGLSTYGRSIIITHEDYENILEILDF